MKKKRRHWYSVFASSEFDKVEIGESFVSNINNLKGKKVEVDLNTLLGDVKKQNVKVVFLVNEVRDSGAYCELVGYKLGSGFIKKINNVAKSKIEDSFVLSSKDGIKFRIKPLIVTMNKIHRRVLGKIRQKSKDLLIEMVGKKKFSEFVLGLVSSKVQRELKRRLSKIYPLNVFEIKKLERV